MVTGAVPKTIAPSSQSAKATLPLVAAPAPPVARPAQTLDLPLAQLQLPRLLHPPPLRQLLERAARVERDLLMVLVLERELVQVKPAARSAAKLVQT